MNESIKHNFKYSYRSYIFYIGAYFTMILLNNISGYDDPYSLAVLAALFILGYNIGISLLIFNLSFIPTLNIQTAATMMIISAVLAAPFIIYKIVKSKPKNDSFFYVAVSLVYYLLKDGGGEELIRRAAVCFIILLLSFLSVVTLTAATRKLFKCKLKADEIICSVTFVAACLMGFNNLVGLDIYKAVSIYLILVLCYTLKNGYGLFAASLLSLPLAIASKSLDYIGLYAAYGLAVLFFINYSKLLAVLAVLLFEVTAAYYFNLYGAYSYSSLIIMAAGGFAFLITPQFILSFLEEKARLYRERHLPRIAINRNRTMLSNKLYEISSVFKELESVFYSIKSSLISENSAIACIIDDIDKNICLSCDNHLSCDKQQIQSGLYKLTKIGMAKGRVNLVDIPSDISANCGRPNNVIYAINRMLADYRNHLIEARNNDLGREMIASQAAGIGEILKGLAFETSQMLAFDKKTEKALSQSLMSAGIVASEILIYGGIVDFTVLIVSQPDIPSDLLSSIVSNATGRALTVSEKMVLGENTGCYTLKITPPLDAAFGVAMMPKDGSSKSGDTYSVMRISESKFLVALSDGMGSGKAAEKFSSAAISLIEGFFKVGMPTELVLSTVNKVLNVNQEENFACLDIAIIDLVSGNSGIIKIGAPFGFIIRDDEIMLLESDSLPLGILDNLNPSTKSQMLKAGDLLLLISDGISLAFGSSTDMFEFLKTCPSKNPQTLCDDILTEAIKLFNGKAEDDMTVVATRLFEKSA